MAYQAKPILAVISSNPEVLPPAHDDVARRFGLAVKISRKTLGVSQEELAWRAGLHRTYISDIERGARNVTLRNIHNLARALEVPLSTLFKSL